ncbi:nucleotide exchange factor GrpE [Sorangium cellulosum]|uniref:Protein GrpE n=1 Tax=Sorangium cellulosum TaxID=56 RepID=A0A150Q6Q6_SORCE|nr:nucleotide exchange factor GrpE [Sorangium cellulosum]KYF63652.1 molecular chaperone GrpE [Sorangium cellulosum]
MSDSEQIGSSQNTEEQAEAQAERAEPAEQRAPTPEDKLGEVQAEAARMREQLLRTAADFDNFRKRSRREVEEAQRRGRESILKDLLPVFDNLERAASHAENAPDVKSVADGVRIVAKQFVDTLDRMGIKRIAAVGKPFDPSVHEAIQQLESTEHPAGVVIAEVQPGYILGDYLIRAAMVVVSKGSPGASSTTEAH